MNAVEEARAVRREAMRQAWRAYSLAVGNALGAFGAKRCGTSSIDDAKAALHAEIAAARLVWGFDRDEAWAVFNKIQRGQYGLDM